MKVIIGPIHDTKDELEKFGDIDPCLSGTIGTCVFEQQVYLSY
jgi:hypothetical protein